MKNVAAYIRVSTDGQCGEDKFGLEVQKQQIEEYCSRNDMQIIEWYADEGESGAKERPGFDTIIYGDVNNPPVEAVIVAKSDRVARDIMVYYYYKMMLRKKGINLISVAEDFGQMGAFASMLEAFTICVAEMERENIKKRTMGGRSVKSAQGGYSGGRAPYGYYVSDKRLVVDEEAAKVIRYVFHLRDDEHMTYQQIADRFTEEGVKSNRGGKFYGSTIKAILDNRRTYEGYYRYGGKDGPWVKGQHEAIIGPNADLK